MPMIRELLPGIIAAAVIAAVVFAFATLLGRWRARMLAAGPAATAIALGAGYVGGHVATFGWPPFPPVEATQWLPVFALVAMAAGTLHTMLRPRWWLSAGLWALVCAGLLAMLLRPKFQHVWTLNTGAVWLAGIAAGAVLLTACLATITMRTRTPSDDAHEGAMTSEASGASNASGAGDNDHGVGVENGAATATATAEPGDAPIVIPDTNADAESDAPVAAPAVRPRRDLSFPITGGIVCAASAGALITSGSVVLGQLALILGVTFGVCVLAELLMPPPISSAPSAAPVAAVLLTGLWTSGYFYSELPAVSALLLAGAPLLALVPTGKGTGGITALALRATLVAVPAASAVLVALRSAPPPMDYSY